MKTRVETWTWRASKNDHTHTWIWTDLNDRNGQHRGGHDIPKYGDWDLQQRKEHVPSGFHLEFTTKFIQKTVIIQSATKSLGINKKPGIARYSWIFLMDLMNRILETWPFRRRPSCALPFWGTSAARLAISPLAAWDSTRSVEVFATQARWDKVSHL